MDWVCTIGKFWKTTLLWLGGQASGCGMFTMLEWMAGFAVGFAILARLMPCNAGMYWWKDLRGAATDCVYWLVVPLFLRVCRLLMLIAGLIFLFGGREPQFLPVQHWPLWVQCLAILLLQDVLLYASHRLFHCGWAWRFHAIHHSPTVLDWMSSSRFHPINNLLAFSLADVGILLLGFSPAALIVLAPFNLVYSAMVHANLNWTFGPFRYIFASPVFHRWHHTTEAEGLNKNFASTFPFLDVLFGTFYMPPGRVPEHFGNGTPDFPDHFWGQMFHPFRKRSRAGSLAAPSLGLLARIIQGLRRRPVLATVCVVGALVGTTLLGMYLAARQDRQDDFAKTEWAQFQRLRKQRPGLNLKGAHTGPVCSVAISADGQRIVSGGEDGTVKVWDAATEQVLCTLLGHGHAVRGVAISGDGRWIVSGSKDRTVKIWDSTTGQEKWTLGGHQGAVLSVAVTPDGRWAASASTDFTAKVWDLATGREKCTLPGPPGAVLSVALSADGQWLVSARGTTPRVWDLQAVREKCFLSGHTDLVFAVGMSADGRQIVSGSMDGKVRVWDGTTGQVKETLSGHTGAVYGVAVSSDGRWTVSGSEDKTVKVWDTRTGQAKLTFTGHKDVVTSVAIDADGGRIASGSRDGTVKVWIPMAHSAQHQIVAKAAR